MIKQKQDKERERESMLEGGEVRHTHEAEPHTPPNPAWSRAGVEMGAHLLSWMLHHRR